ALVANARKGTRGLKKKGESGDWACRPPLHHRAWSCGVDRQFAGIGEGIRCTASVFGNLMPGSRSLVPRGDRAPPHSIGAARRDLSPHAVFTSTKVRETR